MKPKIHPAVHPTIFVDTSGGVEFITVSTLTGEKTKVIDGITYQVCPIEISSASHPFYTGKQMLVDTARRAEKFQAKLSKVGGVSAVRKGKKVKRAKAAAKVAAQKEAAKKASEGNDTASDQAS